jgi:hypothetical protein
MIRTATSSVSEAVQRESHCAPSRQCPHYRDEMRSDRYTCLHCGWAVGISRLTCALATDAAWPLPAHVPVGKPSKLECPACKRDMQVRDPLYVAWTRDDVLLAGICPRCGGTARRLKARIRARIDHWSLPTGFSLYRAEVWHRAAHDTACIERKARIHDRFLGLDAVGAPGVTRDAVQRFLYKKAIEIFEDQYRVQFCDALLPRILLENSDAHIAEERLLS